MQWIGIEKVHACSVQGLGREYYCSLYSINNSTTSNLHYMTTLSLFPLLQATHTVLVVHNNAVQYTINSAMFVNWRQVLKQKIVYPVAHRLQFGLSRWRRLHRTIYPSVRSIVSTFCVSIASNGLKFENLTTVCRSKTTVQMLLNLLIPNNHPGTGITKQLKTFIFFVNLSVLCTELKCQ